VNARTTGAAAQSAVVGPEVAEGGRGVDVELGTQSYAGPRIRTRSVGVVRASGQLPVVADGVGEVTRPALLDAHVDEQAAAVELLGG
jgi:hypothetical protein